MKYTLSCSTCNARYPQTYKSQLCKKCHGILDVNYISRPELLGINTTSFWDYVSILPDSKYYRNYEVGFTKLIKSNEYDNLFLKLELENPTRSFKDRGSVIELAKAHEYGYKNVVCASTGNMAYSIAYYAKLYGIKTTVYISNDANPYKIRDIKETHDAQVIKVNGDFTMAQKLAQTHSIKKNAFLTGDYCYRKEGQKTIMYEIIKQLPDVRNIIVPIGNATLFSGMLESLNEIKESYRKISIPRIIGVQSSSCSPLYDAFKANSVIRYEKPKTSADAIAVGLPTFGKQSLEYMKSVNSSIVTVSDAELKTEQKLFYEKHGIIAELAGVASIAAVKKLKLKNEKTVAVVTGGNV